MEDPGPWYCTEDQHSEMVLEMSNDQISQTLGHRSNMFPARAMKVDSTSVVQGQMDLRDS